MIESFLEQSINPRNRAASKDHHTDLIPVPLIKHSTSFPVNYKNGSITMVKSDGSIVCQQKSKEHETKEAKKHTIIITKQIISLEAKKLIRWIELMDLC